MNYRHEPSVTRSITRCTGAFGARLAPRLAGLLAVWVMWLPSLPARAASDDQVTVLYVNGIGTTAQQAAADRDALAQALLTSPLRPGYPAALSVENAHNPTEGVEADTAELVALKLNEEQYLARLWAAFTEGNDAPAVRSAAELVAIYNERLPLDPASPRAVVQALVEQWGPLLQADARRKLVLVGHSQGNFIVNWVWLGLYRALGEVALQRVRVVNVASSTVWSPFGLDVTLAEDGGVYSFLASKGLGVPRDTPFCRSASQAQGCAFRVASATVTATRACAVQGDTSCHNFRSTYLSSLPTLLVDTRRLSLAAAQRTGTSLGQRLVEAVYTALDGMDARVPTGWADDLDGSAYGSQASSSGPGAITVGGLAGVRSAAVGKAVFDQGLSARWRGCMDATAASENWVMFDMQRRDGNLGAVPILPGSPLWAVGFYTAASRPNTLVVVFGQSAAPTLAQGTQRIATRPTRTNGNFCGQFELAVEADGHGRARFVSDAGGPAINLRSAQPVTDGVKRLNLSASGRSVVGLEALAVQDQPYGAPYP